MRTKVIDKQYSPIPTWNSYSINRSEWTVNGYLFVLEQHQVNEHTYIVLYSKDCPNVKMDSTTVYIPRYANQEYIVTLLANRIKWVYDMHVKFNINNWEKV
jgi:hypothetical protein